MFEILQMLHFHLQPQPGIMTGAFVAAAAAPFTPVYPGQAPSQATPSQPAQTQQLFIATNYQQAGVPPVLLPQTAPQQASTTFAFYLYTDLHSILRKTWYCHNE